MLAIQHARRSKMLSNVGAALPVLSNVLGNGLRIGECVSTTGAITCGSGASGWLAARVALAVHRAASCPAGGSVAERSAMRTVGERGTRCRGSGKLAGDGLLGRTVRRHTTLAPI